MITLIVWNNDGVRTERPVGHTREEALKAAAAARTLDNRTVKLADGGGSTHHWSRSTRLTRNHWSTRAVADEYFL